MGGRNNKLKDQKGLDQKGSGRQRNPPKEILPRVKILSTNRNLPTIGCVVEWLERRYFDRHGLGSKPTCAILLSP